MSRKEEKQPKPDGYFIERYTGTRKHYWSIYNRVGGKVFMIVNSSHQDTREEADELWFDLQQAIIDEKIPFDDKDYLSSWSITCYNEDKFNKVAPHYFCVFGISAKKYKFVIQSAKFTTKEALVMEWENFKQMIKDCSFRDPDNE